MGRTVRDVAMLLSVQAGHDRRAPLSVHLDAGQFTAPLGRDFAGTRIAWLGDWNGYFATDPGVLELCESALQPFRDIGCSVEAAVPDFSPAELWDIWLTQRAWIIGNYLRPAYDVPAQRALIKADAQWEVERSFDLASEKVFASTVARSSWLMAVNAFFDRYDFAIAPTAQVFPFDVTTPWPRHVGGREMETYHQWMGIVLPWTLAGTPVMNAPAGFGAAGLPMGIQIIGRRHAELAVLQLAAAYEAATNWVDRYPPPLLRAGCKNKEQVA
jgi:amidase